MANLEIEIIDLETITEEGLIAAIKENARIYPLMVKDLQKIQEIQAAEQKRRKVPFFQGIVEVDDIKKEAPTEKEINEEREDEINYYIENLNSAIPGDERSIKSVLPSRKNPNYKRILLNLKLQILMNVQVIKQMSRDKSISENDLKDLNALLEFESQKYEIIECDLAKKTEEDTPEEQQENELIFVPTESGNLRALDEISKISSEYYDAFMGLFQSIKDGTFKYAKRLTDLSGLCEVRDIRNGIRVVFDRLDKNHYAIVSAFIKKTTSDKGYQESLNNKADSYCRIKENLKQALSDEEFLAENKRQEGILFEMLENKSAKRKELT